MALKPCRECKKDVSTEASACPHCGVKNPSKPRLGLLKVAGYGLGAFLLLGFVGSFGKRDDNAQTSADPARLPAFASTAASAVLEPKLAPEPEPEKLILSEREKTVLKVLLTFDLEAYAYNKNSMFGDFPESKKYVVTSADQLQRAYEKNEVAGDKQFKDRSILVRGRVESVNRSIGDNYYLSLVGGTNMFMHPHASMADGFTEYLAQVNKGNGVALACQGGGLLMGSAMLSDCAPASVWAARTTAGIIEQFPDLIASGNRTITRFAAIAIGTASLMSTGPCSPDWDKCMAEVMDASMGLKKDPNVRATVEARLKCDPTVIASLFK